MLNSTVIKENIFICLAIILSVASFSVDENISAFCSKYMYIMWALVAVQKCIKGTIKINFTIKMMFVVYLIVKILNKLFFYMGLYPSGGMGVASYLLYCIFFYLIGYNTLTDSRYSTKILVFMCLVGDIIVTITQYIFLRNTYEFYLFSQKNQMGQMIGTGIILSMIILPESCKTMAAKIILYVLGIISVITLFMTRSRTPIIGIAVVLLCTFIIKKDKSFRDYTFLTLIVALISLAIFNIGGIEYIKELFMLNQNSINSSTGLNNITSGRLEFYKLALKDFLSSPIIGVGAYAYIDNFILNILRCGGILLALLILPISYSVLFRGIKNSNEILMMETDKHSEINLLYRTISSLCIFYFVISLMEGYPPLGPGSSVFFLWLMLGIGDRYIYKLNRGLKNEK